MPTSRRLTSTFSTEPSRKDAAYGILFILLGTFFLSTVPVTSKYVLETLSPLHFSAVWMLTSSVWAAIWALSKGKRTNRPLFLRHWKSFLLVGIFSLCWVYLYFEGVSRLDPAVATFLINSRIVWGVLIGGVFFGERLSVRVVIGILTVLGGVTIVYLNRLQDTDSIGMGLILGAAVFFVGANSVIKRSLPRNAVHLALLSRLLVPAVFFTAAVLIQSPMNGPEVISLLPVMAVGSFFGPFLSFLFLYSAVPLLPLGIHSAFQSIGIVFTALLSFLVFKTAPSAGQLAGGAFVIGGLLLAGIPPRD